MFGRVFLLAKIDEQKENLITMLAGTESQKALSDEQLLEIDKKLLVCSMKELKEKFPNLYDDRNYLPESEEADIQNDFVEKIETQAAGKFEVWYHSEKATQSTKKEYTKEQCKQIELYMGIQTFFQHNKEPDRGILFLNISPEELLETKHREKLELYLSTVNHKEDESQAIQLAILPEVEMKYAKTIVRERFPGTEQKQETITQAQVMALNSILAHHKIMLCYQYETGERTSPEAFAAQGKQRYKRESVGYEKGEYPEYMCCCYPNLSSKRKNLYIGAAFVMAGMLASQNPEGMETLLPKELYPYAKTTREEMKREKYGCCLASETGEKGWAAIRHMILFSARTLAYQQGKYLTAEEVLKDFKEREK